VKGDSGDNGSQPGKSHPSRADRVSASAAIPPKMCDDGGHATGWELLLTSHRFQHRMQVFMDESLQELGVSFAQLRILDCWTSITTSISPSSPVGFG
jgi:hypothetical protein